EGACGCKTQGSRIAKPEPARQMTRLGAHTRGRTLRSATVVDPTWRTPGSAARRIPRRTSRPPRSRAGSGDTSWPLELASALIARTRFVEPNGHREGKRRPLAHVALDPDPPTMQLHELLGQRQPESRALLLPGVLSADLAELLENGRLVLRRDPDPRVADGDGDDALGRR